MERELRIASLAPAGTEMVYFLGAQSHLCGVSHSCDFPPGVKDLRRLTRTLIDESQPSEWIDAEVQRLLRTGSALYEIDVDLLKSLSPTLVLAQSQCSVCAVDTAQVAVLGLPGVEIFSHAARSLDEMLDECDRLAERLQAFGAQFDPGATARLRSRCERTQVSGNKKRPGVLVIEWLAPLMSAGNWTPDLIARAGGESVLADGGQKSPYISWENIRDADPAFLCIAPCGFDLARAKLEAEGLRSLPGWDQLQAVKNDRVFISNGNGHFHRCGPRLVETLEFLTSAFEENESELSRFVGTAERWLQN